MALVCVVMASLSGVACGDDDGGTTAGDTGDDTTTTTTTTTSTTTTGPGTTTTADTTAEDTGVETTGATTDQTSGATTDETTGATNGETTGGVEPTPPSTHRFGCLDIVDLGDGDGDGMPDGTAIQALLLQNTWAADIQDFRLNIMLSVLSSDAASGMAELRVSSGIGANAEQLCAEASSRSDVLPASFDAAVTAWQPLQAPGACAEPAMGGGAGSGGTYELETGALDTIYIYAQEADGTELNCVPGGGAPSAVPLHAVRAEVTLDAANEIGAGELTGCLLATEAEDLCSCLSDCSGAGHADCGGCPNGSVPLDALLGGVGTTDNCTALMGAPAYDLRVRFSTQRLMIEEPMVCAE